MKVSWEKSVLLMGAVLLVLTTQGFFLTQLSSPSSLLKPSAAATAAEATTERSLVLNVTDPSWPLYPPSVRRDCQVQFVDDSLSLCYITPWPNFGDELGPPVVKRILELHFGCSSENLRVFDLKDIYAGGGDNGFLNRSHNGASLKQCFMAVGSLWRMMMAGDHIWGTGAAHHNTIQQRCGFQRYNPSNQVQNVTVHSSRGPLSAGKIQKYCTVKKNDRNPLSPIETAGDAGFLVPFLFPELKRTVADEEKNLCFIPHKKDENSAHDFVKRTTDLQRLTVDIGWVNMTVRLQQCEAVLSSSLHGIILSEALGIPNRRLRLSRAIGDFKFADFYQSYRGEEPEGIDSNITAQLLPPLSYQEREAYAKRVLKSFPLHLFHVSYLHY